LNDLIDANPDDPKAWMNQHAPNEPGLQAEVRSLYEAYESGALDAEAAAAQWLGASPPTGSPAADGERPPTGLGDGPAPEHGQTIGRYRLVDEIGAGGMGVVFRAERAGESFQQSVAVKLLHRHVASREARRRFQAEQQVLASLDHPNIARLVDGGVTDAGRPYLVMEYIDGVPITDYATLNRLSVADRVDLLMQVTDAVSAAHQNLVIHRDLKPSNVLVTERDGEPHVKLLDFGIAKILDKEWPATRPVTHTGRGLMTPTYAAPEQLSGEAVSTATDTYQLGVLAYELVTGAPPFGGREASRKQITEAILHTDPEPPSSRGTVEAVNRRQLVGDLDTIILKALRKEPGRRYRTPEVFRRDLQRYREDEPIEARPASLGYRLRKFVRRNRWGVAVGALAAVMAFVSITMIVRGRRAAEREADKAEQVSTFLVNLFEASDPNRSPADTVTARALLDRGRERLETLDDPAVIGQMAHVLGQAQRHLGEYDEARSLLQQAVRQRTRLYGTNHPETLASLNAFALLERDEGHYTTADTLLERVVAGRQALRGTTDSTVVQSLMHLGFVQRRLGDTNEAEASLRRALAAHRTRTQTPDILTAELLFNLAALLRSQSKYDEALPVQRRSYALVDSLTQGPHPGRIANLNNLALLQQRRGQLEEAKRLYTQLLNEGTALYGEDHPKRATWMSNLASLHTDLFEYERADSLLSEAIAVGTTTLGNSHPSVALFLHNRAANAYERGDLAAADTLFADAAAMMQDVHAPPSRRTARTIRDYAMVDLARGRRALAESRLRNSLNTFQSIHDGPHPEIGDVLVRLGRVALAGKDPDQADSLAAQALSHFQSTTDTSATGLVRREHLRSEAALQAGRLGRADSLLQQARKHAEQLPAHEQWRRHTLQAMDGDIALARGETARADSLLQESVASLESTVGPSHVSTEAARRSLRSIDAS
jgi:serine/threonine-protein kinase